MAQQTINIGTVANDGTGDPLRTAFDKVNDNFNELYSDDAGDVNSVNGNTGVVVLDADDINETASRSYNQVHTGEVIGGTSLTIASNVVDADNLAVTGNGTSGQALVSDGDGTFSWTDLSSGISVSVLENNTTAVAGYLYVLTADLTLTLPSSPTVGDYVKISNRSGVDTCSVARNGELIVGAANDLTLNYLNSGFEMIYSGSSQGWILIGVEGAAL